MPALAAHNVSKKYEAPDGGTIDVLDDLSIDLEAGEFVAVTGSSGCGKSTLLLICGGLLRPDAGTVAVGGDDAYALSADRRAQLRARRIGFVFQQFHLIPYLSVRDNVLAGTLALRLDDADRRADELLDQFGLRDRASHVPGQLSVGERQRVALSRALLRKPVLILADEPTGNLDDTNSAAVLDAFAAFAADGGAVLMATHDAAAAARAGRAVALGRGEDRQGSSADSD